MFSKCFLSFSKFDSMTISIRRFFQCLANFSVQKFFLIPNLNLSWYKFMLFSWVLSLITREEISALLLCWGNCRLWWSLPQNRTNQDMSADPDRYALCSQTLLPFFGHSLIVFLFYIVEPKTVHKLHLWWSCTSAKQSGTIPSLDWSAVLDLMYSGPFLLPGQIAHIQLDFDQNAQILSARFLSFPKSICIFRDVLFQV